MSSSKTANAKFATITVVTLLAAAGGLADLYPIAVSAAHRHADRLVAEAPGEDPQTAEVDYRLALWLNSKNQSAYQGLAALQIGAGQAAAALSSLERAGDSDSVRTLKIKALLESNRAAEAATQATRLIQTNSSDDNLVLAAMSYTLAGQTMDDAFRARLASPEAVRRVQRLEAGPMTLAAELYAAGLLNSSSSLISKQPVSYERNLLWARILYDRHNETSLQQAASLLKTCTDINPAGPEARQLLVKVYRDQANDSAADQQAAILNQLR